MPALLSCTVYYVQALPKLGEREAIGVIYPVSLPLSSAPWTIQDVKAEIYRMQRHPDAAVEQVEELMLPSQMQMWKQVYDEAFFFFEACLTYDELESGDLVLDGGVYYLTCRSIENDTEESDTEESDTEESEENAE